jgi:uncharacterized protein YukJ
VPLQDYGVLKGQVIAMQSERHFRSPHTHIHVRSKDGDARIAVNVYSRTQPSDMLFLLNEDFQHPITAGLAQLDLAWHSLPSRSGGVALDYVRGKLLRRSEMHKLPPHRHGPDNDLNDYLQRIIDKAIENPRAHIYAFGRRWGPEDVQDPIFGFSPSWGVHDIHMNQGNLPAFWQDDGTWQDGALLFSFDNYRSWTALFLGFQVQSWKTDHATGRSLTLPPPPPAKGPREISFNEGSVRIIAALVNPIGPDSGHETVTLLNTTPQSVNFDGWQLLDTTGLPYPFGGNLAPGATLVVRLPAKYQLDNYGGTIKLLDPEGQTIDSVEYTQEQAEKAGWTVVF